MSKRRFTDKPAIVPSDVLALGPHNLAMVENRTLFPTTVVTVTATKPDRLLISGKENRKLGSHVEKGQFKGYAIYQLSLEERATCPTDCSARPYCLAPGTRVLTADLNWVPIENLEVGQQIVGFDEFRGGNDKYMTRLATVEALGRTRQPSYRLVTDKGTVICSDNHLWLGRQHLTTTQGRRNGVHWIKTSDLVVGAKISFLFEPWEEDRSYESGRLRGFVEGEGSLGTRTSCNPHTKLRVSWAQRPGQLLDEIDDIATDLGFTVARREQVSGVNGTRVDHTDVLGGWKSIIEFVGRIRPTRFIERAHELVPGHAIDHNSAKYATVLAVEPIGETDLVTIATSTKTLIAEGLCSHNCFGNGMQFARRHRVGDPEVFYARIEAEIASILTSEKGLLLRLHVLGDFFSVEYVAFWKDLLETHPLLAIFGYTHRRIDHADGIGAAIQALKEMFPERFRIRWSLDQVAPDAAVIVETPDEAEGIVCPAQSDATGCCATCGLCWETAAAERTILFLKHGRPNARAVADRVNSAVAHDDDRAEIDEQVRVASSVPDELEWIPLSWGLTRTEAKILNLMAQRPLTTRDAIWTVLYGADPDGGPASDKIIDVLILKIRRKIEPLGYQIETQWGHGYRLSPASFAMLSDMRKGATTDLSAPGTAFADGTTRPIVGIPLPKTMRPAEITRDRPEFRMVRITDMRIETSYQRNLSSRSISLIRKIVAEWSWAKFKAVDLDEPVLTPKGWKRHGDLVPGDQVFGPDGKPTDVIAKTPIFTDADCYRVSFCDGYSVVVSGDHLWNVEVQKLSSRRDGPTRRMGRPEVTISTRDLMAEVGKVNEQFYRRHPRVRVASAVQMPTQALLVDPYLLGVWLGDGGTGETRISAGAQDAYEMADLLAATGCEVIVRPAKRAHRISFGGGKRGNTDSSPIKQAMRELGVLNRKHIPQQYLMAAEHQRFSLLQGLMDSDGSCSGTRAYFATKHLDFATDVAQLIASLGMRSSVVKSDQIYRGRPYTSWQVHFSPKPESPPFRLERKAGKVRQSSGNMSLYRRVIAVEPIESRPVSCIQVAREDGLYLVGKRFVITHNCPIVVERNGLYYVIDGQHTSIAAASHPALAAIPCMVIDAADVQTRASSFIAHNRDRVPMSAAQLFHGRVAAGDAQAMALAELIDASGCRVPKTQPSKGYANVGDIVGIGALEDTWKSRGAIVARRILEICVLAEIRPIATTVIHGLGHFLQDEEFVSPRNVNLIVAAALRTIDVEKEAAAEAARIGRNRYLGLASLLDRMIREERAKGSAAA